MLKSIENIFIQKDEPIQSCLFAMHEIALRYNTDMGEGFSYGMPLITYKGNRFCYIWVDKETQYPYYLIVNGDKINHPALVQGDRKRMKILPVDPNKDMPLEIIYQVFDRAISLHNA